MRKILLIAFSFITVSVIAQKTVTINLFSRSFQAGGGGGADVDLDFLSGSNFTKTGTVYSSTNGTTGFCLFNPAGYFPASQTITYETAVSLVPDGEASKGAVIALTTSELTTCEPLTDWWGTINYAVFPNETAGQLFYRVFEGGAVSDFTITAVPYQDGDKFRFHREGTTGVVKAQYYRSGSWSDLHTFTQTTTAILYPSAKGFEWSKIINPKASSNFIFP